MKVIEMKEVETVSDILCDVCLESTRVEEYGLQYAMLQAHWRYSSAHDGERYEIHLCERCFFQAVASLKQERRTQTMFSENEKDKLTDNFGMLAADDFFNDGGSSTDK